MIMRKLAALFVTGSFFSVIVSAQTDAAAPTPADLAKQIAQMSAIIQQLQHRVDELEAKQSAGAAPPSVVPGARAALLSASVAGGQSAPAAAASETSLSQNTPSPSAAAEPAAPTFLGGTSLNLLVDTYY